MHVHEALQHWKKTVLRTGKAQISMYICVVCSWSSLFVNIFYSPHWFIKGEIPRLIWASLPAYEIKYSWLSLSRPRLSRMPAYLEVKIWSLFKHENLITGNKILWKRGEIAFCRFIPLQAFCRITPLQDFYRIIPLQAFHRKRNRHIANCDPD